MSSRGAAEEPDSSRDAISRALRLASGASSDLDREAQLALAHAHARAYAEAWSDSFFVRVVERFEASPRRRQRMIVEADSLWLAARLASGREGVSVALRLWRQSLSRARKAEDSVRVAAALFGVGAGLYMSTELDSAAIYLREALDLARAIGDHRTTGSAMGTLASVAKDRGDLARAAELYAEALTARTLSGDSHGMAADLNNLGLVERALGDLDGARESFQRALHVNREGGRDRPAALNLSNLGDLESIRGDYPAAQSYYETALDLNRSTGDTAESAYVLHDLGLLAARRGDYPGAISTLSESLRIHEATGAAVEAVFVRGDLAGVQAATGDLAGAEASLAEAERQAAVAGISEAALAPLALARGDVALQLNHPARAGAEYERAERLFREAGDDAGLGAAQQGRALLLYLRDDAAGALRVLEGATRAQAMERDPRTAASSRLLLADLARALGDSVTARDAATSALSTLEGLGDAGGEAAALATLGDLELHGNAPLAAASLFRRALERLGDRPVPDVRWRLHAGLGEALRRRGALAEAARELRTAAAAIEDVAAHLGSDPRRSDFLADKWQVYGSLASVELGRGRPGEAFAVSERMRARQALRMFERGRIAGGSPTVAREQDLRRRIVELTDRIDGTVDHRGDGGETEIGVGSRDEILEALAAAQSEYSDLLHSLRETDPAHGRAMAPAPVDWLDVARLLQPDEVLVQYLLTDSLSVAFVVTRDTLRAIDLVVGRGQIANLVEFARNAVGRAEGHPVPDLWRGALRRLHHYLLEPVETAGLLRDARALVIVPHAELHFLPFAALVSGDAEGTFLVERFELSYAPSSAAWIDLRARQPNPSSRVLALAPSTRRLPASRDEVAAVRATLGRGRTTVRLGAGASERKLLEQAAHHGILHLATYGVLNKHNPLFSWVALAPGGGHDGRLEVHEVFGLRLAGQLVVLSACQTAVGSGSLSDVPPGDDWVGLMQAFVQAGAGSVLASLWSVDDRGTADLMAEFYRSLASGRSHGEAIAEAQRITLRRATTSHPFYWAGFVLSGGRGSVEHPADP